MTSLLTSLHADGSELLSVAEVSAIASAIHVLGLPAGRFSGEWVRERAAEEKDVRLRVVHQVVLPAF
jgi:hypothetical protein